MNEYRSEIEERNIDADENSLSAAREYFTSEERKKWSNSKSKRPVVDNHENQSNYLFLVDELLIVLLMEDSLDG